MSYAVSRHSWNFLVSFWFICVLFFLLKIMLSFFVNWFTFTFRSILFAGNVQISSETKYLKIVLFSLLYISPLFFFFLGQPRVQSTRGSISVVYEFPLMLKYVGNICVFACADRYLWKRDAFDFWFRFTFLCVCTTFFFFFFGLSICLYTHKYLDTIIS